MIEAIRLGVVSRAGTLWDGIDLTFGDGEAWLVAGPPSSGKTILLGVLAGERRPEAGDVVAGGRSLYRERRDLRRPYRETVGFVRERFTDPSGATVGTLFRLSTFAAALSIREAETREEELMALLGMGGGKHWPLETLSTSERARVELALELFRGPRYLFCDRLIENAGREWAETLLALFRGLAREGRTIVAAERSGVIVPREGGEAESVKGPFRVRRFAGGGVKGPLLPDPAEAP